MRRALVLALTLALAVSLFRDRLQGRMFDLTGEEALSGLIRGLGGLAMGLARPPLLLEPEVPIRHNGVNPFGINTFLEQEVELEKREQQVKLIAEAGFHWLRQEFPWYDLEIHGKGDFEDRRFEPHLSAWAKYDHIVSLAEQYGLELIVRLSSPPEWSRAAGNAQGAFAPPDEYDDFADFAAAVAERYRGRVQHYQIWNEPNIYPEWGELPVSPEQYTDLLCQTYGRLKAVDPEIVVLSGALAPTSELTTRDLNDFIFLERMYQAGAGECFDVLSMQGYGLFSGPTDHRMRPIVINYGRNQFIRDIMVRNGDAGKAIWISEMNWNTAPNGVEGAGTYGQVSEEQQARYAPIAYQRAQEDWPWVGVINFWFFKRADDSAKNQAFYYFRMADPDFTLLPVYHSMRNFTRKPPVMNPGYFQESHWAVNWGGEWRVQRDPGASLSAYRETLGGSGASFRWRGTELVLLTAQGGKYAGVQFRVDGSQWQTVSLESSGPSQFGRQLPLARNLAFDEHWVEIRADGPLAVDGFIVRDAPAVPAWLPLLVLGLLFGLVYRHARRVMGDEWRS